MRLVLTLWLAIGVAPGLGEVAESAVHYATAGHLAHMDAQHGDMDDHEPEHGCGTTHHQCGCCASQVMTIAPPLAHELAIVAAVSWTPESSTLASLHEPAPPTRPPIATA